MKSFGIISSKIIINITIIQNILSVNKYYRLRLLFLGVSAIPPRFEISYAIPPKQVCNSSPLRNVCNSSRKIRGCSSSPFLLSN